MPHWATGDAPTSGSRPSAQTSKRDIPGDSTAVTDANGKAKVQTGTTKPSAFRCSPSAYQDQLNQKAEQNRAAQLAKDQQTIENYSAANGGMRYGNEYQTLQGAADDTRNAPASQFLSGQEKSHLAYMEGIDDSIANLQGPEWDYGAGYEDTLKDKCETKHSVGPDSKLPATAFLQSTASPAVKYAGANIGPAVVGGAYGAKAPPSESTPASRPQGSHAIEAVKKEASPPPEKPPPEPEPAPPPPPGGGPRVGEPVSVATGEYVETWRDFLVPATLALDGARFMGLHLALPAGYVSPLGPCQISMFDEVFSNPEPGLLDFFQADGKRIRFARPFNFLPAHNAGHPYLDLRAPWLKCLELRDRRILKRFSQNADGIYRLDTIEDLNGNRIALHRDARGRLTRAEATDGLALTFDGDGHGRRTAVTLVGTGGERLDLAHYRYDGRGRMLEADCAFGVSVRYAWDGERDLLVSWHNITRRSESHFSYDAAGRVTGTRTNGLWNGDRFRYDPKARETAYLPGGAEALGQLFRYDANGNVMAETDALGGTVTHSFDAAGFMTGTADANGHASSTAYDTRGNVRRFTDAEGRASVYGWGPRGELDTAIDGDGALRRYNYDERANLLSETDAEGAVTTHERDDRGRLLRTTFADGATEAHGYDGHGRLASVTDAGGGTTRYAYDAFGRVVSATDPLGGVTRYEYAGSASGFATPSAVVRPDGVRVSRAFTADGVLASATDGEGRTWRYHYGAFDVLQSITDPGGGRLTLEYDGEGRVTAVVNQRGAVYALERDAAGRVMAEVDFDGRRTSYRRDPGGRVVEAVKPDGVRLRYAYDRTDRLAAIKVHAADDAKGLRPLDETHFWYDGRGLLIKASNRAALVAFERDREGRIVAEMVNGRRVASTLDARGRRAERRIGEGEQGAGVVRVGHDARGLVTSVGIDDHAPLLFERDALGREVRRGSTAGFRLDQAWDAAGQLLHQSAGRGPPDLDGLGAAQAKAGSGTGTQRHYAWDRAEAPVGVDDLVWGKTRYGYDANGQVAEARFGDGASERFSYDPAKNVAGVRVEGPQVGPGLGELLAWQSTPGGVVQLARGPQGESIALTHDACGRVVERRVERRGFRPQVWRYGWDGHDRLVRCDNPVGETWFYGYDPFGRRLTKVRRLTDRELSWTAQRHPQLIPESARSGTQLWTWPAAPAGSGGAGDRRPPIVGVQFTWDGDVVAEEAPLRLDGSSDWDAATRWHFEPGGFVPLAKQTAGGELLPIVTDHLGTPREMFDEAGGLRWAASYTTWGVVRGMRGPPPDLDADGRRAIHPRGEARSGVATAPAWKEAQYDCPIRFQGQWEDAETALNYNRNRHYDARSGQYASSDPIGLLGGFRLHAYVAFINCASDPLGLTTQLREMTSGAKPGDGFTGVFDVDTKQIALMPSSEEVPTPPGFVPRRGGHAIVVRELPGGRGNKVGFAAIKQEDGTYRLTYQSGVLNPSYNASLGLPSSRMVPLDIQPQIVDSFQKATGTIVTP